ncbi:uracil-xanthine permease family protein [Desulfobulbus oligotrophicus]|uniref:Purine/pyrimidine permease n=1 Tax=Desulfobulbus oligotrophicus TaxID=1909699 RepID=A0A7T5VD01_9BACT|nr:solute carrier family 23 protein [Desulfobulbus oligotrophicus]QQG65640.1 purine/pyrimidine permease [Desulfobulbus oligotrophicus]
MSLPDIRYNIDDQPPPVALFLFGVQWLAVMGVAAIIMGKVVAALHYTDPAAQFLYMQKLLFLIAVALIGQIFLGHRLPLVVGPAVILLVGIISSMQQDIAAIYSSIMIGGLCLSILCASGLFRYVARLFTTRVVATILILIALTITPTILKLVLTAPGPDRVPANLLFALILLLTMIAGDRLLKGVWRSTLLVWALIGGSLGCAWLLPGTTATYQSSLPLFAPMFSQCTTSLSLNPGLILSFLICFVALAINDVGSIESIGKLLNPPEMERRLTRGMVLTGITNVAAGFLGVIGLVNFSLTTGIIASNGNASRISFLPAGLILLLVAFMPPVVAFVWNVPAVVVGTILLHIMSMQLAAGLMVAFGTSGFTFQDALVISLPVMVSVIVSYLPPEAVASFPALLTPLAGNGFVVGTLTVLLLEHVLLRRAVEPGK